ncbi:MAG: BrnT family toxin [Desulfobacterales bacterium]|nr:BrnT family toxin [Desulfobacterales bacterium]
MEFEWDPNKNRQNFAKHGIAFETAISLWNDLDRVEILAPYPLENRYVLIAKIDNQLWSAVYTLREGAIRMISVRRSRKQEKSLYEKEKACKNE